MRRCNLLVVVLGALSCASVSYGVLTAQIGPDSAQGHPTVAQPGWPVGLVELPRHESRVFSIWENGGELFYFKASPDQIDKLILLFSKSRMRDHELWIKDRKKQSESFYKIKVDYNVSLHIAENRATLEGTEFDPAHKTETANTYEPTLTIYVDLPADRTMAERLTLPDNIIVNNEVEGLPLKGKATKPKREVWFAQVQFDDSTPATDYGHSISTKVTLWEKDAKDGIPLGRVNHKGYFHAGFSEREIADLKTGKSWLTLTAGNWMTKAKSDHPKLGWTSLSREKEKTQPVKVGKPSFLLRQDPV